MPPAYLRAPRAPNTPYLSGCTGKHAYPSEADAKLTGVRRNMKFRPYLCRHCDNWHLTSVGKKPSRV